MTDNVLQEDGGHINSVHSQGGSWHMLTLLAWVCFLSWNHNNNRWTNIHCQKWLCTKITRLMSLFCFYRSIVPHSAWIMTWNCKQSKAWHLACFIKDLVIHYRWTFEHGHWEQSHVANIFKKHKIINMTAILLLPPMWLTCSLCLAATYWVPLILVTSRGWAIRDGVKWIWEKYSSLKVVGHCLCESVCEALERKRIVTYLHSTVKSCWSLHGCLGIQQLTEKNANSNF